MVFVFLSLYFIMAVFSLLLFGAYYFLKVETKTWSENIASEKSTKKVQEILALEEKIKNTNKKIFIANKAIKETKKTSKIIEDITNLLNENIYLDILSLNLKDEKVNINGFAKTRQDVLSLQEKLKNSSLVKKDTIQSPKSNILKKENINFQFTFNLNSDELNTEK